MADPASKAASKGITRRAIVAGAGAGGVGVLAGAAAHADHDRAADEREQAAWAGGDPRVLVYRETDHIRWFYRRARM